MNWHGCVARAVFCCSLLLSFSTPAATLSVSPTSIDWQTRRWIDISVSNVTPGAEVMLGLFVDADGDGAAETHEPMIAAFDLEDGVTNRWGARILPDDDDGAVNGSIQTRISYHGSGEDLVHGIGPYVWQAVEAGGGTGEVSFAVTQATSSVWLDGTVRLYGAESNAVPGAYVMLEYAFRHLGLPPTAWTDTNGAFRIYLPSGVSTAAVLSVLAVGRSLLTAEEDPSGTPLSFYSFTNSLSGGANVLSRPLYLVPALSGLVYRVSGTVVDEAANGVPGALVIMEMEDEEGDDDLFSVGFTDGTGAFSLRFPDAEGGVGCGDALLGMRDLLGTAAGPIAVTGDISGLELVCRAPGVWVEAPVEEAGTGSPVVGMMVEFESDAAWSVGYSLDDGVYELGMAADTNAGAVIDPEDLAPRGYAGATVYEALDLSAGGVFTNTPFTVQAGHVVSGRVTDGEGDALRGGMVALYPSNTWAFVGESDIDQTGGWAILAVDGSYRATARDFDGFLEQNYSDHYVWEWDNGPVYDPLVVAGTATGGIDFVLEQAARIEGTVTGGGSPLSGADVRTYEMGLTPEGRPDWSWIRSMRTETDGTYRIEVPAGTNYGVEAAGPDGALYVSEYYHDTRDQSAAEAVITAVGAPATGIDFALDLGGAITGRVFDADGTTPLVDVRVEARIPQGDTDAYEAGDNTDGSGSYAMIVPAGTYRVRADSAGIPARYYDGWYDYQRTNADPVTVAAGQMTNAPFVIPAPSYVAGTVTDGSQPLTGIVVEIWKSNTVFLTQSEVETNGTYTIAVPPVPAAAAWARNAGAGVYLDEVWSNSTWQAPSYFEIPASSTVSSIDFTLEIGWRVRGTVWDETGAPVPFVPLDARGTNFTSVDSTQTDGSGTYTLVLPTGAVVIVTATPDAEACYPQQYWSGTFSRDQANPLAGNAGTTFNNINFTLQRGYRIEGYLRASDGATPLTNAWIEGLDAVSNRYGDVSANASGWYAAILPTNQPLVLMGAGSGFKPEYASNVYSRSDALPFQGPACTTSRIDFALYGWSEDTDGDGLEDHREDSRPDGRFTAADDVSSVTNADTDADGYSDYIEVRVLQTDAQDADDYLKCTTVARSAGTLVTWRSADGTWYTIQRATDLVHSNWVDWVGVMGTGDVTTVYDAGGTNFMLYRVHTQ